MATPVKVREASSAADNNGSLDELGAIPPTV
jgi:hypothetical protein